MPSPMPLQRGTPRRSVQPPGAAARRVLFLSNGYPPGAPGGYEQLCAETAGALTRRGYEVCVLTVGTPPVTRHQDCDGVRVYRALHPEVAGGVASTALRLLQRRRLEEESLQALQTVIARERPAAALVWGMWNVPRAVPAALERLLPGRVGYYLCDYWPALPSAYEQQFRTPAVRTMAALPKRLLARPALAYLARQPRPALRLERPICVSRAVRDGLVELGIPIQAASIIHNGIHLSDFPFRSWSHPNETATGFSLLYAGRLVPEKGVPTAIRALALLAGRRAERVTLDLVGSGEPHYERRLRHLVADHGLDSRVSFCGSVARTLMPATLARHHALVLPSEWAEPLPRIPMEAMATGLVVIGTTTGGSGELLVEGKTALTFAPGDAPGLARQIERLLDDPTLGPRLAASGRRWVEARFTLGRMVDQLEAVLHDLGSPS
jgi:glycogen(starch) synthase